MHTNDHLKNLRWEKKHVLFVFILDFQIFYSAVFKIICSFIRMKRKAGCNRIKYLYSKYSFTAATLTVIEMKNGFKKSPHELESLLQRRQVTDPQNGRKPSPPVVDRLRKQIKKKKKNFQQ